MFVADWATAETEAVYRLLEQAEVKSEIETLVLSWNEHELLGINLADDLQELVTRMLAKVNWSQLAEHYAKEIAGFDEDELTRRHDSYKDRG